MQANRIIGRICSLFFGASLLTATPASAEGIETTLGGAVGLGRAANVVRVRDFMATFQNPANLAVVQWGQLGLELRVPMLSACFDRARDASAEYRTNDPVLGFAGEESFAEVCNEGSVMPAGNFGWAQSFDSGWGYGVGFFTPTAVPRLRYGDATIVTQIPLQGETQAITANGVESPNRFLLLDRAQLGGFLQAGAGAQLTPWLRAGASVGLGFATIRNRTVASVQGGTFRDQAVLTDVHAADWFIPRATLSFVVTPLPALEVAGVLTYQGDVNATGHVDFTTNGIQGAPLTDCQVASPDTPGPHCRSRHARLTAPMAQLAANVGVRYAQRRDSRTRTVDPLRDEHWDIELDATWAQTSHVDQYTLQLYDQAPSAPGATRLVFSSAPGAIALSTPAQSRVPYRWRDTIGLRLGGDYNVVPGLFSVRLGASYESRAVATEYMNIDAWAVGRYGLHFGATLALGQLRLSAAYAHVFYERIDVPVGTGQITEIVSQNPAAAQAVNEGQFRAALDILSLQASYLF